MSLEPHDTHEPHEPVDRFAYYSLGIQAIISLVALILCFWLIAIETEAVVNTTAFNIIIFIVGVWLGRGVEHGLSRMRGH